MTRARDDQHATPPENPFLRPHPARRIFADHPALVVTVAYLAASVIGLMFSLEFYREFNVNVVNYYQLTDFLMAVLREPITLAMALGGALVTWLARAAQHWEWRWFAKHEPRSWPLRAYKRIAERSWANPWTDGVLLLLYAWVFVTWYGGWKADAIRAGEGKVIQIEMGGEPRERVMLGASNAFLFLYDAEHSRVDVVPHESIERVLVSTERQDRQETP
ncbi:MAG: hypothetical protein AAF184_06870 [Pseudomonadota bacterium]